MCRSPFRAYSNPRFQALSPSPCLEPLKRKAEASPPGEKTSLQKEKWGHAQLAHRTMDEVRKFTSGIPRQQEARHQQTWYTRVECKRTSAHRRTSALKHRSQRTRLATKSNAKQLHLHTLVDEFRNVPNTIHVVHVITFTQHELQIENRATMCNASWTREPVNT